MGMRRRACKRMYHTVSLYAAGGALSLAVKKESARRKRVFRRWGCWTRHASRRVNIVAPVNGPMSSSGARARRGTRPGRRLRATTPDTDPTHGLKISGGFSNIFQRVAVFETFRRQNQPNDARLSAAHPKMSDLPPLVWSRIDATTLEPCPSQTKNARRKTRPRPHAPFTCVARQACGQGHGPRRVWATLPCCRARSYR